MARGKTRLSRALAPGGGTGRRHLDDCNLLIGEHIQLSILVMAAFKRGFFKFIAHICLFPHRVTSQPYAVLFIAFGEY
jgi:hypothetical protein